MPIIIRSPFSGQPVKVRDQDLGRAIRDEEGRIFYVVQRSDGSGYYAAPTRKGSEKDEQRYLDLDRKVSEQGDVAKTVQTQSLHDATGPGRPVSPLRVIVLVLILLALLAVAALFLLPADMLPWPSPTTPPAPVQPDDDDSLDPVPPTDIPRPSWHFELEPHGSAVASLTRWADADRELLVRYAASPPSGPREDAPLRTGPPLQPASL